ncbi:MAG: LURP-one-related family protein [Clostridia bacterium]|nr:LURP-one-related family protein [Clostridia bacterium]
MKLYIRQKVFSWNDKFKVFDEWGREKYLIEGEFFSLGKKLHINDMQGREVAFIAQKVFSFLPRYFVYIDGKETAEIVKQFSFFRPKYTIEGLGWEINGDFFSHDYVISCRGRNIVTISKQWMTWGDCYELEIENDNDEIISLAVVLAIDCVMAAQNAAAAST